MKTFIIDLAKCNGCYGCQLACKDENVENDWTPYAKPQPNTGQFWLKMTEKTHGQTPKVRVEYRPIIGAQDEAIRDYAPEVLMEREDGLIVIDPEKAKGRRDLAEKFEGVYYSEELDIPQGCTGCAHRVDKGELPHCVEACATDALRFGDEEDFSEDIASATHIFDREGSKPHVYYLNPFKLFLSGEVWDPEADLIIEGAKVTLTDADGATLETETDYFGDFWFKHIDAGTYTLSISADGFKGVEQTVDVQESLNIGDFPLARA